MCILRAGLDKGNRANTGIVHTSVNAARRSARATIRTTSYGRIAGGRAEVYRKLRQPLL
jgi:hypothetical protein